MPLFDFFGVTNTGSSLSTTYYFISLKSKDSFLFMFTYMEELMFYDQLQDQRLF